MADAAKLVDCSDCIFWAQGVAPSGFPKSQQREWGRCQRFAPRASITADSDAEDDAAGTAVWPLTWQNHGCGDGVEDEGLD